MRIVIGLGGNALLRRGEPLDATVQRRNARSAVARLAGIVREHSLVLTHGNGPQVGLLSLQNDAYRGARPFPLDVLGAETQGMIGYEIESALRAAIPEREVATVVTIVEVDLSDSAFSAPSKPVGPLYSRVRARRLARQHQWSIGPDGPGFRRLVASPEPVRILELSPVRRLVDAGAVVICAGGGGVPVTVDADGAITGIEAVIDKDLVSTQLAIELGADALLLLTDVDAAFVDWGSPSARAIRAAGPDPLRRLEFASGSMGPKIEAACRFVESGGKFAAIGALHDAEAVLRGDSGTRIDAQTTALTYWS